MECDLVSGIRHLVLQYWPCVAYIPRKEDM